MPGLIIDGKEETISGLEIVNYHDDLRLKLKPGEDMRARHTRWIRSIVWHNTRNINTKVEPGKGPSTDLDHRIAKLWSTDCRNAGAHLSVDWDGSVGCHADLLRDAAYHASTMNEVSIGAELFEDNHGTVYEAQLNAAVKLTIWLCHRFGIQMQMQTYSANNKTVDRIMLGGADCVGVFGHCHQNPVKPFDPGIDIFKELERAGFRQFDYRKREDLDTWISIQKKLGVKYDGVPGTSTRDALQAQGMAYGLMSWPQASATVV